MPLQKCCKGNKVLLVCLNDSFSIKKISVTIKTRMNQEVIEFQLYGLTLQEPMAVATNWSMSIFCLYAFFMIRKGEGGDMMWWKRFFLSFSIAAFLGGTGHLFFHYLGVQGKFPNWIFITLSGFCAGFGMLVFYPNEFQKKRLGIFIVAKGLTLLLLAIIYGKFLFIAIDSIITYIIFCGIIARKIYNLGRSEMRFMYYGVLLCLPSVFIFFFKINLHRFLNKDDLSHLLMLGCLMLFYKSSKQRLVKSNS